MIKELLKEGNKRYFEAETEQGKLLFYVYEWQWEDKPQTIEKIDTAFKNANIPSYIKERYTMQQLINEPLAIFQLNIYNFGSELQPMNMSLWEYKTFIKKDQNVPKALKMAFISNQHDESYFYIACESNDSDSMVTKNNMNIVNKYVNFLYHELETILHKNFSHIESY